ncbi:hypothetical protein BGZ47_006783 [Haplosporangium gracile]|nr:hypothetical protein BGZ47_006783 [Haplosporangium gracile]
MSEKKGYSLLPTTASEEEAQVLQQHVNSAVTPTNHLFRGLLKVFKLSVLVAVLVFMFYPDGDDDGDKSFPRHRHGHRHGHGDKKKHKYTFETHMQTDVDALVAGSLESSIVWDRLAEMTDTYGNRIVGSEALEKSIDWIVEKVKGDGLSVTTEEVIVDYWQRNEESLYFLSPTRGAVKLHVLGLGFSAPTPDPTNGLEAEVVVVTSKTEVDELGAAGVLKGRIVLYNKPFESYNSDVIFRTQGANWAQEHGAVAVLVRSIGPLSLQSTHTGNSAAAKIPAASVSMEDAQLLSRVYKRHQQDPEQFPDWPKVRLAMNAKTALKSKISRNIIVELKGRETPEEVIAIGGHIDSWDVGVGAVDDGAGCFIAWEALRQLSKLDRPPRRTVRAVFWTSEENGSPGGRVYAANHPETNTTRHVFAFESDNGVFDPYGIKFTAGRRSQEEEEETKFNSYDFLTAAGEHFLGSRKDLGYPGAGQYVSPDGGGADIGPLCKQGVACAHFNPADPFPLPYSTSPYYIKSSKPIGGRHGRRGRHHHDDDDAEGSTDLPRRPVDSGYFYYHHTEADTMGAFTPDQVKNSAAVMAIWTYIAAESQIEL